MTNTDLPARLKRHQKWLDHLSGGVFLELLHEDLRGADLGGANLTKANLQGADLRRVNLRGADLWRVNLREANLSEANLQGADLRKADLREANLRGADLRGAKYSVAGLLQCHWFSLSPKFTLELMRHDAESCGVDRMNKWAKGGPCPFSFYERDYHFSEVASLWSPGTPTLRGRGLLEALAKESDIRLSSWR